jgi:LysM repeat protein
MYLGKYIAFNQKVDDYMKYLVEQEDTLFGLELKFNVSGKDILELNQLSS